MIKAARVILRNGRETVGPIRFSDPLGVAVGNAYMLNLDKRIAEWKIDRIIEILEEVKT